MDNILLISILVIAIISLIISIVVLIKSWKKKDNSKEFSNLRTEIVNQTQNSITSMGNMISQNQAEKFQSFEERFKTFSVENANNLENIRNSVEKNLKQIQDDNNTQLDKMRETVDEKLQKTLENKVTESFKKVSDLLENVYKGLGEMKNLAAGVGDLKKVLSNVKSRGILGEVQLKAILEEILSPEQYDENVATKKCSSDRVEFAIKLPASDEGFIYLPIDSKFPMDTYQNLKDAYEIGDKTLVDNAFKTLRTTILKEAKDISSKYIDVPNTTEFAIMFLPFEGLYAEVVNRGLIEELQKTYKVNVAGPSTMAALLNSIQMGFKTLAVQKRSTEVWQVLGAVKTEFSKFNDVLESAQKRLDLAQSDLDKLVGTRTKKIMSKLKSVEEIDIPLEQVGRRDNLIDQVMSDISISDDLDE